MSGRIKQVAAQGGAPVQLNDDPPLGYSYQTPSGFDIECGTYGLGRYSGNKRCEEGMFLCGMDDPHVSEKQKAFGACLHAMDCAMHEEMRVDLHDSDPLTTFMHQVSAEIAGLSRSIAPGARHPRGHSTVTSPPADAPLSFCLVLTPFLKTHASPALDCVNVRR
jgi:hypothetical protein